MQGEREKLSKRTENIFFYLEADRGRESEKGDNKISQWIYTESFQQLIYIVRMRLNDREGEKERFSECSNVDEKIKT